MAQKKYSEIIKLVREAAELAKKEEIDNLLQPGLVKEMIIADILGHNLIHSKRDADAKNVDNPEEIYEYLSCKEGGSGQFAYMFKKPPHKKKNSLNRIKRNHKIFYAVFYADDQTRCKVIYEIEPKVLLAEAKRKMKKSSNEITTQLSFSITWAKKNGCVVYENTAHRSKTKSN